MRLVACALAGAAMIFFAFSSDNSDGIELLREFRGQVDSSSCFELAMSIYNFHGLSR